MLADIVAGLQLYAGQSGSVGKAGWRYPTLQQRLQALQILLAKVVPDLKAQELTGAKLISRLSLDAARHPPSRYRSFWQ